METGEPGRISIPEPGFHHFPLEAPGLRDMAPVPVESQEWYFTFGYGQSLRACPAGASSTPAGSGIPLDNCYVKLTGTRIGARAIMATLFGQCWCDQYSELPDIPGFTWHDLTPFIMGVPGLLGNPIGERTGR